MGKKKTVNADVGRTRLELRFDDSVFVGIKEIADGMQVSVNQLMQGLARWAISNAKLGDPVKSAGERGAPLAVKRQRGKAIQPGSVWFGTEARFAGVTRQEAVEEAEQNVGPDQVGAFADHLQERGEGKMLDPGSVFFHLDFTERRVVVED